MPLLSRGRSFLLVAVFVVSSALVSSCSSDAAQFCKGITSVAGFTTQFSQGLDNFSEDQYSQLRTDTERTRNIVNHVAVAHPNNSESSELAKKINVFISAMEKVKWDVSVALSNDEAVSTGTVLGSPETLTQANTVESLLINECGLPSTLAENGQSADTLPGPSIPSPTQTDPPTNTINEQSEESALGYTVATLFHLNISASEASCLGAALQGVVDVSSANANLAQYQSQFQRAFDSCSISFTVPTE